MKPRRLGLRARFIVFVLAGVGAVTGAMTWANYYQARESALAASQERLSSLVRLRAAQLSRRVSQVAQKPTDLAATLEAAPPADESELLRLLRSHLAAPPPVVYGMAAAYAPYAFQPDRQRFSPYVYRSAGGLKAKNLDSLQYNYPQAEWYLAPTTLKRAVWSEPYFDEGGADAVMTTVSVPFFKAGRVQGVATADLVLDSLQKDVAALTIGREGWAFLLSKKGTFLAAPQPDWLLKESIFSLAQKTARPELRLLGQRMTGGEAGVLRLSAWRGNRPVWLAFAPVEGTGWSFGAVAPESEIMAPVVQLTRRQVLYAGVGLAALVLVVLLLVIGLTRPLKRLTASVERLAGGDLSSQVEGIPPGDEVGDLAANFNQMVGRLRHYVAELTKTTAAKERMEGELELARQIQQSILPRAYPAFPEHGEFDLLGRTIPARQVGGDFYDYFLPAPGRLGLLIGDVSGKGIPAALFMTVARTLIRNAASHHLDPAEVLAEANRQLLPDNDLCMFVTVVYGVYEPANGALTYASAGHPAPLLRRAAGQVSQLPRPRGMALGVRERLGLEVGRVNLETGDSLLLYTDGLNEGANAKNEMFGLARTREWLDEAEMASAPEMLASLLASLRRFTGDTEQSDDLTLLWLRRTR
ncbi:MAG: HAMP domain-containing protein [Desulfarculus sp.]|nr:MAG: HAMP domain-containing protein [Desulfarculus sp.]